MVDRFSPSPVFFRESKENEKFTPKKITTGAHDNNILKFLIVCNIRIKIYQFIWEGFTKSHSHTNKLLCYASFKQYFLRKGFIAWGRLPSK